MAVESTECLPEMSTRPVRRADKLACSDVNCLNVLEAPNSLSPNGLSMPAMGWLYGNILPAIVLNFAYSWLIYFYS